MMENIVRTAVALVSIACGSLWTFRADAQTTIPFLAPPARPSIDENNVDLVTGQVSLAITDLSIGRPGAGGLSYTRYVNASSATDEYAGVVTNDNTGCTFQSMTYFVTIGGSAFRFNRACPSGTTYTPTDGDGSTLTENASSFTYTARDGTVAIFSKGLGATGVWGALATITSLTLPDGEIRTYNYLTGMICRDASCSGTYPITRLQSVTNNRGYQIKYLYRISTTTNIPYSDYSNWFWITQVMGINMAVDYCDPFANACPGLTQSWPTASYNFDLAAMNTPYMLVYTVTDQLGGTRSYNGDISGLRVRWRNSPTDNVTYAFIPPTQQDPTPSYRVHPPVA